MFRINKNEDTCKEILSPNLSNIFDVSRMCLAVGLDKRIRILGNEIECWTHHARVIV